MGDSTFCIKGLVVEARFFINVDQEKLTVLQAKTKVLILVTWVL